MTAAAPNTKPPAPPGRRLGGDEDDEGLFARLAERVRGSPRAITDVRVLAGAAGITRTELGGLVRRHAHLSPDAWLERERVRFACRLLDAESAKSASALGRVADAAGVADAAVVADAAGFADERALEAAFLATMRLTPEAYLALEGAAAFALRLPEAYRDDEVLAYHGRDPESRCEKVEGKKIYKALAAASRTASSETEGGGGPFVLEISLRGNDASCVLHAPGPLARGAARFAHGVALRMLGLASDVAGFEAHAARDARMRALHARRPGLRLPLAATPFDGLCWAIIGQQINVRFASALRRELLDLAGEPVQEFRAHPSPERVASLDPADLRKRRFSRSKAEYLIGAARAVAEGRLALESMHEGSAVAAERDLTSVRGIGTWTARYMLMRGAGFADCAPVGDAALAAALAKLYRTKERPGPTRAETLMQRHAPYRSLATAHLWASLRD